MSDEVNSNLHAAIEQEEIRLRERLAKIAEFKRLARELSIPLSEVSASEKAAPQPNFFDGTIIGLVACYRGDPRSPYHALKAKVRNNYDGTLNRISADIGYERVADLSAEKIKVIHEKWSEGGKVSQAHSFAGKLRLLAAFGATVLDDPDCIRFSSIMRTMRFKTAEARTEPLAAHHVYAIRAKAHEMEWHSIALAQALQFDLKLRSIDVIGEWVPLSDPATSDIVWGNEKWVRGLRWSDIDDKLNLRFSVVDRLKRKFTYKADLTALPMTHNELSNMQQEIPKYGPLIICETNGRPYSANEFRRKWRIVASRAGVPDNVRNADSIRAESYVDQAIELVAQTAG